MVEAVRGKNRLYRVLPLIALVPMVSAGSPAAASAPRATAPHLGAPQRLAAPQTHLAFLPALQATSLSAPTGGVVARDDHVYVGDGPYVAVIDVSDAAAPALVQRLGPIEQMCDVLDLAQDGQWVYALCRDERARLDRPGPRGGVAVLSTASTDRPAVLLGTVLFDEMPFGLAASDGWVYVSFVDCPPRPCLWSDTRLGVLVIDARGGRQPTTAGAVETRVLTQDMVVLDRVLLAGGGVWSEAYSDRPEALGVSILDLADPSAPRLAAPALLEPSEADAPNFWCSSMAVQGRMAVVAGLGSWPWLHVLDVSAPEAPRWLGHDRAGPSSLAVTVAGDHPVVLTLSDVTGVSELAVLAPFATAEPGMPAPTPEVLGRVALPREPVACHDILAADGGLVFVVDAYGQDLFVVDVSEPTAPRLVGRLRRTSG